MTTKKTVTESDKLIKELIDLLFKRANLRKKVIAEIALKEWACEHINKLTKAELKKYDSVIL